jgi:hypothetical protein
MRGRSTASRCGTRARRLDGSARPSGRLLHARCLYGAGESWEHERRAGQWGSGGMSSDEMSYCQDLWIKNI